MILKLSKQNDIKKIFKRWKVGEKQRVMKSLLSLKIELSIITYKAVKELMKIIKIMLNKFLLKKELQLSCLLTYNPNTRTSAFNNKHN